MSFEGRWVAPGGRQATVVMALNRRAFSASSVMYVWMSSAYASEWIVSIAAWNVYAAVTSGSLQPGEERARDLLLTIRPSHEELSSTPVGGLRGSSEG